MGRWIGLGLLGRGILRELGGIRQALVEQNRLLLRLAEHLAPTVAEVSLEEIRVATGIDHLNDREMGFVLQYVDRCRRDLGREPSEEEILVYLADESTHALQSQGREA